jgi:hypothetical protein
MSAKKKLIIITLFVLILYGFVAAGDDETKSIMPFVSSNTYCSQCHTMFEINHKLKETARACSTYCLTCHKEMECHHKVGAEIKCKTPPGLKLTEKNRLACITCHDLRKNRYDSSCWHAESFLESIFYIKSRYKTYFLVLRNNDGQLCRSCH